ncbi:MAG: right-handed parallel beta-helix repeat-containing protein, partial [Planctomycetota bacterium]
ELPATIEVPGNYPTIQAAVDAAVDGDTIIINRGTYRGLGIYVDKAITLTSVAPDDPCTVAATVMDMAGYNGIAIYLGSNCGPGTVISGLTIANAHVWHHDSLDGFYPGDDGFPGGSLTGAGIYVRSGASPVIVNCIIEGARFQAGMAGNGIEGADDPNDPNADPPWHAGDNHGGNGGDGGSSSGGGIYCESYSSPTIRNCRISDCQIMGGDAGNGAAGVTPGSEDSLPSGNGGNGGVGGRGGGVFGGGIYVGYRSTPSIEYCVIENCSATAGNGGNGGNGGAAADPCRGGWGGAGGESGRAYGGGIYFDPESEATVTNCQIINCSATAANAGNGGDYGTAEHGWGGPGYGGGYLGEYWKNSTYGGGVYCGVGGVITFEDCTFQDNTVTGGMSGIGGIGYWGRTMPYYSYVIPSYGAGVFCDAGSVPTFIGCDVIGNQASEVYEAPDPNAPIVTWALIQ